MRRFFSFWLLCVRTAFWGNADFANDWQWVFGNPAVSAFGGIVLAALGAWVPRLAKQLGATDITTGNASLDSFIGALAAFIITWFVAFFVRLVNAPTVLYLAEKSRADNLQKSFDESRIDPQEFKRQELVDREFLGFGSTEIEWLQRMLVGGRPMGMPDSVWRPLERAGLVERDYTGPMGIKDELKAAVGRALVERTSLEHALEIIVGSSSKYRQSKSNPNSTTETISIGVRNSHASRRITNCRISMRLPETVSAYAYLLLDGLTLEALEERLVPVAYFHEFREKTQVPDRIRIPVQPRAGYTMRGGDQELPIKPSSVSFDADSTETKSRHISCKMWLDDHRKLQLEQKI
jgi:hypothetical protein